MAITRMAAVLDGGERTATDILRQPASVCREKIVFNLNCVKVDNATQLLFEWLYRYDLCRKRGEREQDQAREAIHDDYFFPPCSPK